jgi:hypothetical protein
VHCGPIYAGQSLSIVLRRIPAHVGRFHYQLRFYDLETGQLLSIAAPDGSPMVIDFDETVDPIGLQMPGYRHDPSPSPSIPG